MTRLDTDAYQPNPMFTHLKSLGHTPRFHGNGFVQLYVGEGKRLHIWSPRLPAIRDHNATLHNHRYDVHSEVLYGKLIHTIYSIIDDPRGKYQRNVVNTSNPEDKPLTGPEGTGQRVSLVDIGRYEMSAGSFYVFPYPFFHTSEARELTVTLFEQVNDDRSRHPVVISPFGKAPTHAFDPATAPSEEVLWEVIHNVCRVCAHKIADCLFIGEK